MKIDVCHPLLKSVINASSRNLERSEGAVLNEYLNITSIKHILYFNIIPPFEEVATKIPKSQGDELKCKVRQVLEEAQLHKPNKNEDE